MTKKVKIVASVCTLAVVGGVATAAGVLIYNSTARVSTSGSGTSTVTVSDNAASQMFPGKKGYQNYPFLPLSRAGDLDTMKVFDVPKYLADGTKSFAGEGEEAVTAVVKSALKRATGWPEVAKYNKDPSSYQIELSWKKRDATTIDLAMCVSSNGGIGYYDFGTISL